MKIKDSRPHRVWLNFDIEGDVGERFREDARVNARSMRSHARQLVRDHVRRLGQPAEPSPEKEIVGR